MHSNSNMFKWRREEWRLQPNHMIVKDGLVQFDLCDWLHGDRKCWGREAVQECVGRRGWSTAARCLTPSPHSARNQTIVNYPPHLARPPPQCRANISRFAPPKNVKKKKIAMWIKWVSFQWLEQINCHTLLAGGFCWFSHDCAKCFETLLDMI